LRDKRSTFLPEEERRRNKGLIILPPGLPLYNTRTKSRSRCRMDRWSPKK